MRKILPALVLGITLAILIAPVVASAADTPQQCCKMRRTVTIDGVTVSEGNVAIDNAPGAQCASSIVGTRTSVTNWGLFCIINTFNVIVDWFFLVLVVLAVFFTILGAFSYLTAAGSKEKLESGKNYILYAAIGLAIAFIARAIPSIVKAILG